MATLPGIYRIRVRGQLGPTMLSAFPALASEFRRGETVLTGVLEDQSALYGVIAQIEAFGLDLLELSHLEHDNWPRTPRGPESPTSGEDASPE